MKIQYSQSWEDPETIINALEVNSNDNILSIASGGDNSFALLLQNPKSITIIDKNPLQIFLVELKIKAMEVLEFNEFLEFVGVIKSRRREFYFNLIEPGLSEQTKIYWNSNKEAIEVGIIHIGKFEKYFSIFRKYILPLIHSKQTINRLFEFKKIEDQYKFYCQKWDNKRWQWIFKIFFGKFVLGYLGRDPSFFNYVEQKQIAAELNDRTKEGFRTLMFSKNYFVRYILKGYYDNFEYIHPYLTKNNYYHLKSSLNKIHLIQDDVVDHLSTVDKEHYSKYNLSDIFEYISNDQFEELLRQIFKASADKSKLAYWTLFVTREIPVDYQKYFKTNFNKSEELFNKSMTFFYGGFRIVDILKDDENNQ